MLINPNTRLRRYGLAMVSCAVALAMAWALNVPMAFFFLAVLVSSLYAGKGAGLLSVALAAAAYSYLFLPFRFGVAIGSSFWAQFAVFLGTTLTIVGITTARRHVSGKVQKGEYYLAEAERLAHIGSWASVPGQDAPQVTYCSAEMFRIMGFTAGEVPTTTGEARMPFIAADSENWPRILELYEKAGREGIAEGEFPLILPGGSNRIIRIVAHAVRDAQGALVEYIGTCIDVTEQHGAETALQNAFNEIRNSEAQLRAFINTIPTFAWSSRPDGFTDFNNESYLNYTGLAADRALGLGWMAAVHPDDLNAVTNYSRLVMDSGKPGEIEARLRRFDGVYRWFLFRTNTLLDESGHVLKWYGTNTDIEDRKHAEDALRATEARLSRATRTATLGEFSASIAHEINQPLAAIVANAHACLRWLSAEPPGLERANEAAERIVRDGKEAGEVVRRIRALFKHATLEKVDLDLNEVISEVVRLVDGEAAKKRVAVETNLNKDLAHVTGDRVQLQQLIFNLLLNGIEAMDAVLDRPKKLIIRSEGRSPETVLVEIRDCGVGMEDANKAFEAFFTTKENGLGMGLAVCRSIVDAHRGQLWAVSDRGAGTTFSFTLPVESGAAA
jgi:PAS domain S-box-containing protein